MEQIIGMKDATQWTAHSAALQRGRGGWGGDLDSRLSLVSIGARPRG